MILIDTAKIMGSGSFIENHVQVILYISGNYCYYYLTTHEIYNENQIIISTKGNGVLL